LCQKEEHGREQVEHTSKYMPEIRRGTTADLPTVAAIQAVSPDAAHWSPADYLDHEFLVAIVGSSVAGFAVFRQLAPDERELLNIAVAPEFRRKGVARALWHRVITGFHGNVFLEVRDSNEAAIALYKSLNFKVVSTRQNYYQSPPEAAIVMKFHSC
jgi:[ribosomal protein S18]-alanine N-acetyltransferase